MLRPRSGLVAIVNAQYSDRRLERRLMKEAKALVRDVRASVKRLKAKDKVRAEAMAAADTLDAACKSADYTAIRDGIVRVDKLISDAGLRVDKSPTREYTESIGIAVGIALLLRLFVVEAFKIPSTSMIPTMEIGDHIFLNKFVYGLRIPLMNKKFVRFRSPERGEVIVFENPCEGRDFIKRVVAVGGDTVEVRCNQVYVNGDKLPEVRADEVCTYRDHSPMDDGTYDDRECLLYEERNGDRTYHTAYNPGRIEGAPASQFDFPRYAPPRCKQPDSRSPEQQQASLGAIVNSPMPSTDPCGQIRHYVVPDDHVFVMGDNRHNSSDSREWGPVPIDNVKGKVLFIWLAIREGLHLDRIGHVVR